tara:strand:+ start:678 stop:1400 length:723 start_codon:yes stop_codon:yes gene_type:complete
LDPVGDFWDHLSAGDNDMTLAQAQFDFPGQGDSHSHSHSLIDVSSYMGSGAHDPHPAGTDLAMPHTTAFHHNQNNRHATLSNSQTLSSASSTGNLSPEMCSLTGTYHADLNAANLDDHSPDTFNPDLFMEQQKQHPTPHNPSPISSTSHSTNSTPKSSKSTTKADLSPPTTTSGPNTKDSKIQKRTLNTLAARRYRQKRVDQVSSLETSLKETQDERDELKLKVARLEAEVEVLRGLVRK